MMTMKYLYGVSPIEIKKMKYFDALEYKLKNGENLYAELYHREYESEMIRDRLFFIQKALQHTRLLLKEREA